MSRTISAAAILLAICLQDARADDLSLSCRLHPGNDLALTINGKSISAKGHVLKNLDQQSVSIGAQYITFKQAFNTYNNARIINRSTLKLNFKTILKAGSRVVMDESGSCAAHGKPPRQAVKIPFRSVTAATSTVKPDVVPLRIW